MAKAEPVAEDRCHCGTPIFVYLNAAGLAYSNCGKCRRHVREYSANASRKYLERLGVKEAAPAVIPRETPAESRPATAPQTPRETPAKTPRIGFTTLLGRNA